MYEVIEPYSNSIISLLKTKNYQNISTQNSRELQKMQSELVVYHKQLEAWEFLLKSSIELYDKNRKLLETYLKLWEQTKLNAIDKEAPDAIIENIIFVITNINKLAENVKIRYDKALTYSQIVTTKILTLKDVLNNLKENEALVKDRIFYQNQDPLHQLYLENNFSFLSYISSIKKTIYEKKDEVLGYFEVHEEKLLKFAIISFLGFIFIIYFNFLYRKQRLFVKNESLKKKSFFFISRPISTFIILFELLIVGIFPDRPNALIEMQLFLSMIPIIRILQTVIKKENRKYIYIISFLYLSFLLNKNSINHELESRLFLLGINISLLIFIVFIVTKKILSSVAQKTLAKFGNYLLVFFIIILCGAIFANLYGTVLLSSRIIDGVLSIIYSSMIFYVIFIILTAYVVIILRRRISTASNMLEKYSKNIENNIKTLIKIWMFLWWFLVMVKLLSIYPYLISFKNTILALSWDVANITISVQSTVDFLLIIVATWVVSRLTKTILEVEIFARFKFPRGVPTAILTTINYIIVIAGTIFAFLSLGVSAEQFALVFGALGVGIGFGLRNIIANFVSGIIMVFERPVQIGDTIEVDNTMGSIQSIGARSSTIKTFDGSEVIIPNADFISKEITNWTLSDEHRRKTFEFKVDLDNDIDLILKIMEDVVSSHPDVLKDPKFIATFKGFGEYYLEFKVYFWLSQNIMTAHSEVAIGIYKALKAANIKMPIQKTDLRSTDTI